MKQLPCIKKENGIAALLVDGQPFVILGGEIHNSSSSSLEYMKEKVWPNIRGLNVNTLLVPVFWELLEPVEDKFDFSIVDGIIQQANEENIRLVLLWFGLWKNGESNYVPGWVKKDYKKYFRACYHGNIKSNTISPLCIEAVKADAKAFKNLMRHIREVDGGRNTVIMMQVENEIGFLRSDRDYSDIANEEFKKEVPPEVRQAYGKSGNWTQVFGEEAGEYFMAYCYARAVEQIAKSGTEEYPIPMYANAWLQQYPDRAGFYPSGGPIAKVMKMWRAVAPTICLYAPDIYVPNFIDVCAEYSANDNPLFIPEARKDVPSVTNVFYAIGKHNALGFCPFGIEDLQDPAARANEDDIDMELVMALNIDVNAIFNIEDTAYYLSLCYGLLGNMMGIINKYRGTGKMTGFLQNNDNGCILSFSEYDLHIKYRKQAKGKPKSGGLVIEVSENEFIFAGIGFSAVFLPKPGETSKIGYVRIEEGRFENDRWIRGRVLNGDEGKVSVGRTPAAICVELYKYC